MKLGQTIEAFLNYQLANGRSPHTIGAQQRDLRLLVNYLDKNCDIENISPGDIDNFFLSGPVTTQSNSKPKQTSSVNRTRASIKGFFKWLTDTGQLDHNPGIGIQIKRKNSKPPVFLTDEEKRVLLKTIRSQKGWQANRDLVTVNLFLYTGIRLSELVNLNVSDVNLLEKRITIKAKGGQLVHRFLNTKIRVILHGYLKTRKKFFIESQALFISQLNRRITTRQVQRRLDQWIIMASIEKHITPHSLRHSFASSLFERTSNLLVVQQALGHAQITTTQIYSHLFNESFEEALETL